MHLDIMYIKCIAKATYLEKLKQFIIWSGGSSFFRYIALDMHFDIYTLCLDLQ